MHRLALQQGNGLSTGVGQQHVHVPTEGRFEGLEVALFVVNEEHTHTFFLHGSGALLCALCAAYGYADPELGAHTWRTLNGNAP